jgi:hypothetical protein
MGKSRLILSDSAISLGIRMTREFPDLATRLLRSKPKSPFASLLHPEVNSEKFHFDKGGLELSTALALNA